MKLSIPVPVYNFAEFLPETLQSIVSQEGAEQVEIIVVDSASTDNTPQVMAEFCAKYPNVRYHRLPGEFFACPRRDTTCADPKCKAGSACLGAWFSPGISRTASWRASSNSRPMAASSSSPSPKSRSFDFPDRPNAVQDSTRASCMVRGLLISHSGQRCGVYQYGRNLHNVLSSRNEIEWIYQECEGLDQLASVTSASNPDFIVFNFQASTLPWLTVPGVRTLKRPLFGIYHESNQELADRASNELFDFWLCPDPTIIPRNPAVLRVPRFVPPSLPTQPLLPELFTIGSFGFATPTKGFAHLCELVNAQFERASIRLNLPRHDRSHIVTPQMSEDIIKSCRTMITKPGIELLITHEFFDDRQLVEFLASNTLNAFLYSEKQAKGLSSCIDFALAAKRPIAITRSPMFQHLAHLNPSIYVEDRRLADIAAGQAGQLEELRAAWAYENAAAEWNAAILAALGRLRASADVPDGRGFNKMLDETSRQAYATALSDLRRLAPQTITRKIERANIQQAFALDTTQRILNKRHNQKLLSVGSYEDTATEALHASGYTVDEVDPNVNGMTLLDLYTSSASQLGTYDIVLCVSVLEHVKDDIRFLRMISEFLKPGGTADTHCRFRGGLEARRSQTKRQPSILHDFAKSATNSCQRSATARWWIFPDGRTEEKISITKIVGTASRARISKAGCPFDRACFRAARLE